MAKSKLKTALENHKGTDFKLQKQRKLEKEAKKRQEKRDARKAQEEGGDVDAPLDEVEVKVNGKAKKSKGKSQVETEPAKDPEWETDDSNDEDDDGFDDDDMPDRPALDLSHLEDSESDISSDEEGDQAENDDDVEEEGEEDIPLSDLDSIASEDKGDIIPHQRLTINNTAALTAALKRIQLPYSKLAFSEHQSVTTDEPVDIPDIEDDLNRELAFYKQCLSAVKDARGRLKKEGVPFSRPPDYFAEMVKSDEHMGKIKQKLIDSEAGKKAAAEARKQRDLKKFGKQVQVAKLQERAKEKRETLDKINLLKRSKCCYEQRLGDLKLIERQNGQAQILPLLTKKTSLMLPSTTKTLNLLVANVAKGSPPIPSVRRRTRSTGSGVRSDTPRAMMQGLVQMDETFQPRE